ETAHPLGNRVGANIPMIGGFQLTDTGLVSVKINPAVFIPFMPVLRMFGVQAAPQVELWFYHPLLKKPVSALTRGMGTPLLVAHAVVEHLGRPFGKAYISFVHKVGNLPLIGKRAEKSLEMFDGDPERILAEATKKVVWAPTMWGPWIGIVWSLLQDAH